MIPFVDLSYCHELIAPAIEQAIRNVLIKGIYVLGEQVSEFEKSFACYLGTQYCVSVNSGSDALYLALKALGIKEGDEVITVSHTFISTVDAILRNGAVPVLCDIEPKTYCIDVEKIKKLLTRRTKAILPVHLYGHPAEMDGLLDMSRKYGIWLIEDACQAHGATYRGQKVGTFGHMACFSFYPTKNLGALGDGGAIVTNNADLAERLYMLRNYGQKQKYHHLLQGVNSRLDELQAAILCIKLKYLDVWNKQRQASAEFYNMFFEKYQLSGVFQRSDCQHVYHLYVIQAFCRDALMEHLKQKGIQTSIHYPIAVHQQKAYQNAVFYKDLSITEKIVQNILSLPLYVGIRSEQIQEVVKEIVVCLKSAS